MQFKQFNKDWKKVKRAGKKNASTLNQLQI